MTAEKYLREQNILLPSPPKPVGSYVPVVRSGNLLFLSGALPLGPDGLTHKGKVGRTYTVEEAAEGARQCALNLLAVLRAELESLDRVRHVISLTGYVNGVDDFEEAAAVMNGASDFVREVFGERGAHSRAAVSVNGLPKGAAVEVSAVVSVD